MRRSLISLLVSLCCAGLLAGCGGDTAAQHNNAGNELFDQQRYSEALLEYRQAADLLPEQLEPLINSANTHYEMGDYLTAIDELRAALESPIDPALKAIVHYNLGNAYYRQREWESSIGSYKDSLRINPDDLDAKYNLELAQRQLEQEQEQQEANQQPRQEPQEGDQQQQGQPPPRPTAPPSRMSREQAERELERLRDQEERLADDIYRNYAAGDQDGPVSDEPGLGDGRDW